MQTGFWPPNSPEKADGTPYVQGDHNWVSDSYPNESKFWCQWCEESASFMVHGDPQGGECTWRWWDSVPATFEAPCDNGCCDCSNQKELVQLRCQTGACEGLKYNVWENTALGSVLCVDCFNSEVNER